MNNNTIKWNTENRLFKAGTVAQIGRSLRLQLHEVTKKKQDKRVATGEFRIYMYIRTWKSDGAIEDALRGAIRVATFKKCASLHEAQEKAEAWFRKWYEEMYIS